LDSIFSFIGLLSVVSVVLTSLWFLVPKGAGEKHFRYVMGIFIIAVIVAVFNVTSLNNQKDIPALKPESSAEKADTLSCETAKYVLEELLKKCNIKFKEVVIIMDNSSPSGISITKARIEFVNEDDFNIAAEIIKKQTGIILVR